jgi:integrase
MFNIDNVRQGFFERDQAAAIIRELPEIYAEIVRFASISGWRISEVLRLRWEWVDRAAREIRLPDSKNGRPRTIALVGDLSNLIERRWGGREYSTSHGPALAAFVFHQRQGRPVAYASYRRAFVGGCRRAGVTGRTTHDFRRTVARDLRRAGVSETVAMSITGHETALVFRRYAIIDARDQIEALQAKQALLAADEPTVTPLRPRGHD